MRQIWKGLWGGGLVALQVSSAFAHGMVGQRTFIEPFVTEDANPKDEFVLARPGLFYSRAGRTFSLGFSLEKKLSENFSVGLEGEWASERIRRESRADGFQNPGIVLKYALWKSPVHEFILSPAVEVEFPLGDRQVGAERDTTVTPLLLWAKGLGDLPQSLVYLRPLAFMGDAGCEILTNAQTETTLRYNALVMYSLPYLHAFVRDFGTPWPLRQLVPLVEFNFASRLNGAERTTEARVTPGLMYLGTDVQLGVAGQFPLNHATTRELDPSVLFIVDLFYDDFLPALTWTPF